MFKRIYEQIKKPTPAKKKLSYVLKFGISGLILILIFGKLDLKLAWDMMRQVSGWVLAAVFMLSALRHYIQINNWRVALQMNPQYVLNKNQLWLSYFVGQPLRFLIPGGPASFAKILYVKNSSRLASLISTSVERLFLTWATWFFAALAAFLYLESLAWGLRFALLAFCALLPFGAAVILGCKKNWRQYQSSYLAAAPQMMLFQVANSAAMYLQYYLLLNAIGSITLINSYIGMALTNISNSIPITISGLGLREGFAIFFLKNFGFGAEQAVAATLGLFVFQDLLPALLGLVLLLKNKSAG